VTPPVEGQVPTVTFAHWLTSTPHKANIENVALNGGIGFLSVGYKGGFTSQDFSTRDRWIGCGNCYWQSSEPEIPALSWNGFPTLDLAFEMFGNPINGELTGDGWWQPTGPVDPVSFWNCDKSPLLTDAGGYPFLYYRVPSASNPDAPISTDGNRYAATTRAVLSSSIYLRGRTVGVVPRGGVVLAAAIQKLPKDAQSGLTGFAYRLLAIVHDPADQPSDRATYGVSPHARLWYADLPFTQGFAALPGSVIRGVFGERYTDFPWIVNNDPWAWHDGGLLNVADGPVFDDTVIGGTTYTCVGPQWVIPTTVDFTPAVHNLLLQASQWRFRADGKQAVCLRQYANGFTPIVSGSPVYEDTAAGFNLLVTLDCGAPNAFNPPATDITFSGNPLGRGSADAASTPLFDKVDVTTVEGYINQVAITEAVTPIAVDYDKDSNLVATFRVVYSYHWALVDYNLIGTATVLDKRGSYVALGTGDFATNRADHLDGLTPLGTLDAIGLKDTSNQYRHWVLSCRDAVWGAELFHSATIWTQRIGVDPSGPGTLDSRPHTGSDYTAGFIGANPAYPGGGYISVGGEVFGVHIFGTTQNVQWFPNNTPARLFKPPAFALGFDTGNEPYLAVKYENVTGTYLKNRFADTVHSYQFVPQPGRTFADNGVTPLPVSGVAPRGGWCTSSFADQTALKALIQTPGANLRFAFGSIV
jgi:hypothetical protein